MQRPVGSRVSLCMIVRNEEENLAACLSPVAHLFDEIIVVDTGSTDRTREIAIEFGAEVYDFPWIDDFSAARNASLRQATGDWIFWLDADDRVDRENVERLGELFNSLRDENKAYNVTCVLEPQHEADAKQMVTHTRLFRRHPEIIWRRRIHEEILSGIVQLGHQIIWSDVEVGHVGYQDPITRQRKIHRDRNLLRLDYALNPNDPVTLFYLGQSHVVSNEFSVALGYLLRCHKYAKYRSPMVRKMYALATTAMSQLWRKEEALALTAEGLENFPDDPELLFMRASLLGEIGDLGGAERCLLRLIRASKTERYFQFGVDAGLADRKSWFHLGLIYCDQGRFLDSERAFQELLSEKPDDSQAWVGLGQVYIATRRWQDLEHVAKQLRKCPGGDVLGDTLTAEGFSTRGIYDEARNFVERAIEKAPRMVWPRIVLAELLMRRGDRGEECLQAWQEVLMLCPGHAFARRQLSLLQDTTQRPPLEATTLWTSVTVAPGNGFAA